MRGRFPLLPRKKDTDKSRYGHVFVLAGSRSMSGAAVLASLSALRSGSGLVTLGMPKSLLGYRYPFPPEVMQLGLPETGTGSLSRKAHRPIIEFIRRRRIDCAAIGPGLSTDGQTGALVRRLVGELDVPVVLDADGLAAFTGREKLLLSHRSRLVLTPHAAEFKRLFGEKWPADAMRRAALAKKLSKFYDVVLVLKGHRTLVVYKDGVYANTTGNPGMATGGTGDVLTGILASFIAQGLSAFHAATWAVYFHGKAGDLAVREKGELSLLAGDLVDYLPKVFKQRS